MEYTFVSATVLLLVIVDPFGNIPLFASALAKVAPQRRLRVVLREVAIAYGVLLLFMFGGNAFLRMLHLTDLSLQMAGGTVLFLIAIRMTFPSFGSATGLGEGEPLIVPLAIPALAGPSALATVMLLVSQRPDRLMVWIASLTVTMAVCAIVFAFAAQIERVAGPRVIVALERLMGLVLVAVAVEMIMRALTAYLGAL